MSETYQAMWPTPRPIPVPEKILAPSANGWGKLGKVGSGTLKTVLEQVWYKTGITPDEMLSGSRRRQIARARFWAMHVLYETRDLDGHRRYSLPAIGRAFGSGNGGMDHTTVLAAIRRHARNGGYIEGPNK